MSAAEPSSRFGLSPRARAVILTYALAVLAFGVGIVFLTAIALTYTATVGEISAVASLGMSLIALQGLAFPLVSLTYLHRRGLGIAFLNYAVPSLREVGQTVLTFIGTIALVIVAGLAIQTLGLEAASNSAAQTASANPEIVPLLILASLLLIGPGEELLFRGVIQGTLRKHFSAPAAILLASGAFAPLHITALVGDLQAGLVTIAVLFLPSLAFGYAYEKTDNLVVPALAHGLYDAFLFAMLYLATAYAPEAQSLLGL
ncbi:CPBP family intramembrane glutamic endopeptidase [Salarchaeum sp. JOR-1]|uniref:CPBP family intramembrane glutamic endopeptidase n=1 Tax=Salarchaeum sp. JOR-1 TaxID=2599399 RepID=UPI0011983E83|nr:type II CAAX endopeptidase family protein [Salarchaeum sp. JOR-1]QDX39721.1 CPBP family intramembrane metalloprotease [Salarchaeum sp. JOR-1]